MKTVNAMLLVSALAMSLHFSAGRANAQIPKDSIMGAAALGSDADGDFVIGPDYTNAPESRENPDVPRGSVYSFVMQSGESKFYPGLNGPYRRGVYVYVPKQYISGTAAPFIVAQDGKGYVNRLPAVLDNLISEHRLPAMVAVMIDNGGGDGRGSERGLEYDTVSARYADFVEAEVLPEVERRCHIALTKDPNGRATMGGSSGAACAFTMAWFRPDLYRRVLSYSGTFVNQQSPFNRATPGGAWEYHEHMIARSDKKPLRIWLEVGENDLGFDRDEASLHNWVMANERMAAVLKAKHYHYRFVFCKGARHVDRRAVGETLPGALVWLWQGYPVN